MAEPIGTGLEGAFRFRLHGHERIEHLGTHLELRLGDRRPQPGHEVVRRHAQRSNTGLQHAAGQTPPAGVRHAHPGTLTVAEEDRQAIGRQHHAGMAGIEGHRGIRTRRVLGKAGTILLLHVGPVHLFQPQQGTLVVEFGAQATATGLDRDGIVADVIRRVEGRESALAGPALARGHECADRARRRPVGQDQGGAFAHDRLTQVGVSAASRRKSSNISISSGKGARNVSVSPVPGCTKASLRACSA